MRSKGCAKKRGSVMPCSRYSFVTGFWPKPARRCPLPKKRHSSSYLHPTSFCRVSVNQLESKPKSAAFTKRAISLKLLPLLSPDILTGSSLQHEERAIICEPGHQILELAALPIKSQSTFCDREIEIEFRLFVEFAQNSDSPIVCLNNLARNRQTESRPFPFVSRNSIELIENPGLLLFSQSRPRIDHTEANKITVQSSRRKYDLRVAVAVFERVG